MVFVRQGYPAAADPRGYAVALEASYRFAIGNSTQTRLSTTYRQYQVIQEVQVG